MRFVVAISRVRGLIFTLYLRAFGANVGRRLEMERGACFRHFPHRGLVIGDGVYLGRGVIIDVPRGAQLALGDGAWIYHYTIIAAAESVTVGAEVQVAERCSIRDGDHGTQAGHSMKFSTMVTGPVTIGAGAWVGSGVAILRGSHVGAGAVIGANSVLRGVVPDNTIAVGAPARVVKERAN